MEYKVKDLTFTMDDLVSVPLMDLKTGTVSRSHLIHILPRNNKATILVRAGDYLEQSFVTKYLKKGMSTIYQLEVVSQQDLAVYRNFWDQLRGAQSEEDKLKLRDKAIERIAIDFFKNEETCYLSFLISCFEEFYSYPGLVMDRFQEVSMTLYSRALLKSSISTIAALTNGYVDYHFLKDFYNTVFIMDYGLVEYDIYNYVLNMACESERKNPGSGIQLLKKMNRSEGEQSLFLNHPEVSYEYAITNANFFHSPELLEMIKMHHEKSDGSGFPKGYPYSAMTDVETMLTFCDHMIPFEEHDFKLGDGHKVIFENFASLKRLVGKTKLPIIKIMNNWEAIMMWAMKAVIQKEEMKKATQMPKVDEESFGESA